METLKRFFDVLKSLPTWGRAVLLLAIAIIAFVLSLTSCARSTFAFQGEGTVEMIYKGVNGPELPSKKQ